MGSLYRLPANLLDGKPSRVEGDPSQDEWIPESFREIFPENWSINRQPHLRFGI